MCNLNEKTQVELISLLLQRFHSIEAQNGTFGPDCRFPQGKRKFGNPSWGRLGVVMGHLGVNTWANLSQLGAFWIVLNPLGWFWVRFGLVSGAFGLRFGCILDPFSVRIGFVRFAFVSC